MCGLAGFLDRAKHVPPSEYERLATRMADALAYRGPDDAGTWCDTDAGVALGHRRLAVVDLSVEGHQPMISACERFVISYNGEIYNYRSLRETLGKAGRPWRGTSDTEVILEAFSQWGVRKALSAFNGMFAMAVWDRERRTLTLARDRFGEKPLYYGWSNGVLLFGSELKALFAHPAWDGRIDELSVGIYMERNYIPAPRSIFENVSKLPVAHAVEFGSDGSTRLWSYWNPAERAAAAFANPFPGSEQEAVEELDALIRDSVALRMIADVPLGAFLSGGIDSSTVVAGMQAISGKPVRTFTIGYEDRRYDEAEHARAVAEHLGTEHTELYVCDSDFTSFIDSLPELYDEPFSDVSQVPTTIVSRLAREHVTVALSGDGGDELFCGYPRFWEISARWQSIEAANPWVRRTLSGVAAMLPSLSPLNRLSRRFGRYRRRLLDLGLTSVRDMYHTVWQQWGQTPPLSHPAARNGRGFGAVPALADAVPIRDLMFIDSQTYLPDDIFAKVDRATMSVSLEARAPLVDHRIAEFAWSLPTDMLYDQDGGKRILRQVLYKYVPRSLVDRPKQGFDIPIGRFLRAELRDWAEALLSEERLGASGLVDVARVRAMWRYHLSGSDKFRLQLWNILMLQAWFQRWLTGRSENATDRKPQRATQ